LQYINFSMNQIKEIPREIFGLINLQIINFSTNKITEIPREICCLINLEEFYCRRNEITEIPKEMECLINLKKFYCQNNKITKIPKEIFKMIKLEFINFATNKITKIPKEIENLINLTELNCCFNEITEIPREIWKLINLGGFYCNNNQITEIPKEMGRLINLRHFYCPNNKIKEIPIEITNCRNLSGFDYSNNQIEYILPQVARWLNHKKYVQKIYNDVQSVHNHSIQQGVTNSINYIMKSKPKLNAESLRDHIMKNQKLQVQNILLEYCDDKTVHSVLNITFEELLISVYDFILKHAHKDEIFDILNKEMQDSLCKCFTGRISRLINCLNGFDENIIINISDAEQIGNIFILVKQQLESENRYADELFKNIVKKELQERNYDDAVINEWLGNI